MRLQQTFFYCEVAMGTKLLRSQCVSHEILNIKISMLQFYVAQFHSFKTLIELSSCNSPNYRGLQPACNCF